MLIDSSGKEGGMDSLEQESGMIRFRNGGCYGEVKMVGGMNGFSTKRCALCSHTQAMLFSLEFNFQ